MLGVLKLGLFFTTAFFGPLILAKVEVIDFLNNLRRFDDQFRSASFEKAYPCGSQAKIDVAKNLCSWTCQPVFGGFGRACQSICTDPRLVLKKDLFQIESCQSEEVLISSREGEFSFMTKEEFLKNNKNPLRIFIQRLPELFKGTYKVDLRRITDTQHTLGWKTPQERKVEAWQIELLLHFSEGEDQSGDENVILTLLKDENIPLWLRVARFRMIEHGTVWRLDEIL